MTTQAEIARRWADEAGKQNPRMLRSGSSSVYVSASDSNVLYSWGAHFPLAVMMPQGKNKRGWFLLNGDNYSVSTSRHQSIVRDAVARTGLQSMILPFSALERGKIDRDSIKIVAVEEDRWERTVHTAPTRDEVPETHRTWARQNGDGVWEWETQRHWLGASVFTAKYVSGWKKDASGWDKRVFSTAYFLSAFDEQEPRPLYFLAQLPKGAKPKTVVEAFEALKPPEVKEAEALGRDVVRQGDVFAIATTYSIGDLKSTGSYTQGRQIHVLGVNHTATDVIRVKNWPGKPAKEEVTFARGILRHDPGPWRQRDHVRRPMGDHKTWYWLVKNTVPMDSRGESRAWSMGGNVD